MEPAGQCQACQAEVEDTGWEAGLHYQVRSTPQFLNLTNQMNLTSPINGKTMKQVKARAEVSSKKARAPL